MLTDDLEAAMQRAAATQPFIPEVAPALGRYRQLRNRQRALAATSVLAIVALAGVVIAVVPGNGRSTSLAGSPPAIGLGGPPVAPTTQQTVAAFAGWGPTRGDLANDSAYTNQMLAQWHNHPSQASLPGLSISAHLTGQARVLYAGTTPDGVAGVVTQPDRRGLDVGFFFGTSTKASRLVYQYGTGFGATDAGKDDPKFTFYDGDEDGNLLLLDPWVVSFVTDKAGRHIVVLPVNPADTAAVSYSHTLSSTGQIERAWSPLATTGGVGIADVPSTGSATDTLVRISQGNTPVDISPVAVLDRAPAPANVITGNWIGTDPKPAGLGRRESIDSIDDVAGNRLNNAGSYANNDYVWVHQAYGTSTSPYPPEPFGASAAEVDGDLRGGWYVQVKQEWLWGDAAHTVVTLTGPGSSVNDPSEQVVADPVTQVDARPLIATRLPHRLGWIVVGGPGTTVTGWRTGPDAEWVVPHAAMFSTPGTTTPPDRSSTRKAVVLNSNDASLQLRLDVRGRTRVVSVHS